MEEKPFVSSSSFKPKLNDQDFMELVCENGKILAKGRKNPESFKNQRTHSLLDLYETEYDESFKKHIKNNLEDTQVVPNDEEQTKKKFKSSKIESKKNVEVTTSPPDEQSIAMGRSTDLYFASSTSMMSSRDLSYCSLKRKKYGDIEEEEESTYLSNNSDDDESDDDAKTRRTRHETVKKRKRSTEVHRLSERKRRNEINKRMRALQDLVPNCYKDDKTSLLDEAIKYMRTLQLQVQMMSMGNGLIQPHAMFPMGHYPPMSLGMNMGVTMPQIPHMTVQGTGFSRIDDASSQMLSFFNHPIGLVPNSPIFAPLENCSTQFVVPSCAPQTQTQTHATSFTQFPRSASTSNLDGMQFRGSNGYYHSLS